MTIKFNVEPYYDDFLTATAVDGLSPQEKYHRILFRPGHAVQARELTQLQSVLQNQITQMGNHFFEEGSMVIPGHCSLEAQHDYVKLSALPGIPQRSSYASSDEGLQQYNTAYAAFWKGLEGLTAVNDVGAEAQIVKAIDADGADPITLYVKYTKTGTDGLPTFSAGDSLTVDTLIATVATGTATGYGSLAFIDRGIYFIRGNFVIVQEAAIVLDKYDTSPSYDIGLRITESIATAGNDPSLNDNANGTPNYAAPGAHRYQIKTQLVKQANEADTVDNFLLLLRVVTGTIQQKVRATDYAIIEETLARRTFDESGNYTVRPFLANVREHTDINNPGRDDKLSLMIEPSKAYVRGYEIETLSTIDVDIRKARNFNDPDPVLKHTELFEAASVPMLIGNYVDVENVEGMPDIQTFGRIDLKNGAAATIGYARARSVERKASNRYRIYLFDIVMNTGQVFGSVTAMYQAGTPPFNADVYLAAGQTVATVSETNRNSLVFPLPFTRVKTCNNQADGATADFDYELRTVKYFGSRPAAAGQVVFTALGADSEGDAETFEPYDEDNWILICASGTDAGDVIDPNDPNLTVNITNNSTTATFTGLNNIKASYASANFKLIAGAKRTFRHKTKSLVDSNDNPTIDNYPVDTQNVVESGDIRLQFADGYKLHAVYMSADFSTSATTSDTDVTEYYDFDNGQRDNYYDICRLKIKPNTAFVPSGRLLVVYEYYLHGDGDFFTVDSYDNVLAYNFATDENDIEVNYEDIPKYTSKSTGQTIELRSAIDFRPRVNDNAEPGLGNFGGTGAKVTTIPEPLTTFSTDVQYYLNRIDKVYLDKDGQFGVIEGVPAVNPELPSDPKDAMVLYHVYVPGYTLSPNEVDIEIIDNKRYTMRDIGKLEKRINSLEYYTALSLLEKEAADREIIDPATQTQRLKSGFLVDSFNSHNIGNVISNEYRAAIDRQRHQLRPLFTENNVRLMYEAAAQSPTSNIRKTGDLITLDYTETSLYYQGQGSNWINVNPFNVFEWGGSLEISPSSDEWKDTTRRPQVIVDQEGVYDAMLGIINETDALGTVWGEWQTNWTGTSTSTTTQAFGNGSRRGRGNRIETTTTTTTERGQSRTGIETSVVPDTITTNLGDRVVEVNFAPFVRSRIVAFKATRLKPNTEVIPYFDGINVSDYCRAEYVGELDTNAFKAWDDVVYAASDNPVVNGQNNHTEHPVTTNRTLMTNDNGELVGTFFVPNNSALNFRTGTRTLKLADADETTYAEAAYSAKGLIETKENVTISTRIPSIERREVVDGRIVRSTSSRTTASWYDPLAQSFMVDLEGGAFITSIDLFFHTKDPNIPVTLQIREMNQGLPTNVIVPFGEVTLNPSAVEVVDLSTTNATPNVNATKFTFPSPVFLQQGVEYCFVVMANSDKYQVWYAGIGEDDYASGKRISKQPYAGVLFKSQNASTWSPDQNKDMKFRINRADFNIDDQGIVVLENAETSPVQLIKNPITTTSGSSLVRIQHRNHHLYQEINQKVSQVTITGAVGFNGLGTTALDTPINGTHDIVSIEMDSYTIDVGQNATATGIGGGADVTATENMQYNTFFTFVQQVNLPATNTSWGVRTSNGVNLGDDTTTPYVTAQNYAPVIVNQDFTTAQPKVIAAGVNSTTATFALQGTLSSTRDNVSPFIDLDRCSVIGVSNRISNPCGVNTDPGTSATYPYVASTGDLIEGVAGTVPDGYNLVTDFHTELENGSGSCPAKYVTKTVQLAEAADGLRVFLDINRPTQTYVDLYYKAGQTDVEVDGSDWVLATPNEPVRFADDNTFSESEYVIDPAGVFNVFALKIVLRSSNTSRIPTCRDLRSIALVP